MKSFNLKIQDLFEIIICLFPIAFQYANITGNSISYYFCYILLAIAYIFYKKELNFSKSFLYMIDLLVIAQLIIPLLSGYFNVLTIEYFMLMFLLLIDTYICGFIFSQSENIEKLIRNLFISNSVILIINISKNTQYYNYVSFMTVFNNSRSNRAYFGFTHPNFAGMFLVIETILAYILFLWEDGLKKILFGSLILFFIVSICVTGSRTAFYNIVIFFIIEILRLFSDKFQRLQKPIFISLLLLSIILIGIYFGSNLLSNFSGRITSRI